MPQFPLNDTSNYDVTTEVDLSRSDLHEDHKPQLKTILRNHSKAFIGPDGNLGHYNGLIRHRIDLIENVTIPARKVYRVPL